MLRLEQKVFVNPETSDCVAYVDAVIVDGPYTYSCRFDEKTKKRFNAMCRTKGFIIGKVVDAASVPARVVEL